MEYAKEEWLYEMLTFLLCTEMRVGEAAALTWGDIDYVKNVIHVTKTMSKSKDGHERAGSPQVLKTIRGHSSLAMTMDLYSHVMPNTRQAEMDNIKIDTLAKNHPITYPNFYPNIRQKRHERGQTETNKAVLYEIHIFQGFPVSDKHV